MQKRFFTRFLKRHIPFAPRHDDLYVVEFPKSGITWVTTVIANICREYAERSGEKVANGNFYLNDFIPDIHMSRHVASNARGPWPGCRIIKSHSFGNRDYLKAIYIVRNPISVMGSYHDYSCGLGHFSGSFSEFIRHKSLGIAAWTRHVNSWAFDTADSQRIILLKYEDLRADTHQAISKALGAVGAGVTDEILSAAVSRSNFANMRVDESRLADVSIHKKFGRFEEFTFVNKGRSATEVQMNTEDRDYIDKVAGVTMKTLGYE